MAFRKPIRYNTRKIKHMKANERLIMGIICALFLLALWPNPGGAQYWKPTAASSENKPAPASKQAQNFIDEMGKDAISFLSDPNLTMEQKKQKFSTLLDQNYDMEAIGRFCLGHHWKTLTAPQQEEYQVLFKDLIVSIYARQFSNYKGQKFKVEGAQKSGPNDVTVQSFIVPAGGENIAVDWHVRSKNGAYKIMDVKVEGVSMAITKKSEFASVIQRAGGNPEVLLEKLRTKEVSGKTDM